MTKKMVQKVSLMLCMCFLFCMFGASSAFASEGDKGDKTGVDISWLEDDNGQLNEVTNKAKGLFGSVYGLVMDRRRRRKERTRFLGLCMI